MDLTSLSLEELIEEVNKAFDKMNAGRREWNMACGELQRRKDQVQ